MAHPFLGDTLEKRKANRVARQIELRRLLETSNVRAIALERGVSVQSIYALLKAPKVAA